MIVLGLTGSIGMGKTTTAGMFAEAGAAVYDADAEVHALYERGGSAGPALAKLFPEAVSKDGAVLRDILKTNLARNPERLGVLEDVVFPLLAQRRDAFFANARSEKRSLAVLDIPLLFETKSEAMVDAVVLATADPEIQGVRVLSREGMDEQTFEMLKSRQLDDREKRRMADFIVDTGMGLEHARKQVREIYTTVLAPEWRGRATATRSAERGLPPRNGAIS